jgi:hypothetical protein
MHDQPEATEEEQGQVPDRLEEEEEQRAQDHSSDTTPANEDD